MFSKFYFKLSEWQPVNDNLSLQVLNHFLINFKHLFITSILIALNAGNIFRLEWADQCQTELVFPDQIFGNLIYFI